MPIREIVQYGHPTLHTAARNVEAIDPSTSALLDDMIATMHAAPGIGLAAPQIGVPLRVIVIDLSVGRDPAQIIELINPVLIESSGEQREDEGCLSVSGHSGTPTRPARVVVRGLDRRGESRTYEATGLLARAFCHEIDHIDGRLFIDRLNPLKRSLLTRKLRKRAAREGREE
ncbi:MAG: peptide deformylase [Vicinamibacteria bacterium]|jgi:peptide deformylase|nr:peptide deformylase [Vicinamibacteria bacterium]